MARVLPSWDIWHPAPLRLARLGRGVWEAGITLQALRLHGPGPLPWEVWAGPHVAPAGKAESRPTVQAALPSGPVGRHPMALPLCSQPTGDRRELHPGLELACAQAPGRGATTGQPCGQCRWKQVAPTWEVAQGPHWGL